MTLEIVNPEDFQDGIAPFLMAKGHQEDCDTDAPYIRAWGIPLAGRTFWLWFGSREEAEYFRDHFGARLEANQ